jgi:trehalose-phosphatase
MTDAHRSGPPPHVRGVTVGSTKLARFLDALGSTDCPVLIATDFDGTLASITPRHEDARLTQEAKTLLVRLARIERVRLAVVTGRSLRDILARLEGITPLWISPEHGAVLVDPTRRLHVPMAVPSDDRTDTMCERSEEIATLFAGAVVERKVLGVALHYRSVDPGRAQSLIDMFRLLCATFRAEVLLGRSVVEGRFSSSDKGVALARILRELPSDLRFVYAGDDVTDEPALSMAAMAPNGLGLYVGSAERPLPSARVSGILDGPAEWLSVLGKFADVLEKEGRRAS